MTNPQYFDLDELKNPIESHFYVNFHAILFEEIKKKNLYMFSKGPIFLECF